jgi:hypothetical protein
MRNRAHPSGEVFAPFLSIVLLAIVLLTGPSAPAAEENYLARSMRFHIVVQDPDAVAGRIIDWTESRGGYFLFHSRDRVKLRVPLEEAENFRAYVEGQAEELVEVSLQARDLRERAIRLRAGIKSREEILDRNLSYLGKTGVEGTLAIEREIMGLVTEIEGMKGELRKLEVDRRYISAEVSLSFKDQTLPTDIPSSFAWINSVDFYRFVEGN